MLFFFSYQSLCAGFASTDGYEIGFWGAGITCFGGCVLVSNIKVALFSNNFSVMSVFFLIGSIVVYIISFAIVNKMTGLSEISLEFEKYYLFILLVISNLIKFCEKKASSFLRILFFLHVNDSCHFWNRPHHLSIYSYHKTKFILFIYSLKIKFLGFNKNNKNKPKVSALFNEKKKQNKGEMIINNQRNSLFVGEEDLQGQGIQVVPLTKKKSIKRTRIFI